MLALADFRILSFKFLNYLHFHAKIRIDLLFFGLVLSLMRHGASSFRQLRLELRGLFGGMKKWHISRKLFSKSTRSTALLLFSLSRHCCPSRHIIFLKKAPDYSGAFFSSNNIKTTGTGAIP
ncbi:hypothetical protein [Craterilacuibacter sinensis]|uniref:Uncharacterized protein n=1 Tax=Craterilacuibacter sinensis TaxID=2686017 RepID=A0A845BHW7_9NEIS|nr:hypothetical protein [Craterilacuibacter sinensis]MXR35895.1 hypothetical protein [Craterilacuibacter sinensis]